MIKPLNNHLIVKKLSTNDIETLKISVLEKNIEIGTIETLNPSIDYLDTGDYVVFDRYAGTTITICNKSFLIMKESELIGIIPKDKDLSFRVDKIQA